MLAMLVCLLALVPPIPVLNARIAFYHQQLALNVTDFEREQLYAALSSDVIQRYRQLENWLE